MPFRPRRSLPSRIFRRIRFLEDWLLPPVCLHCGLRKRAALDLCLACLRVLRGSRPEEDEAVTGFPWIRALFRLTPPLQTVIHGFKYRHQRRLIVFLCGWLHWRRAWIADTPRTYDAVIAVPLHPARERERGYNQAREMARAVSALCGMREVRSPLRRVRFTGTQTRLRGGARHDNLEDAFRVDSCRVAGKRFLLVDDVCTTGSTLTHCRDALLRAGAARVDALVLARVEKQGRGGAPDIEGASGFFS